MMHLFNSLIQNPISYWAYWVVSNLRYTFPLSPHRLRQTKFGYLSFLKGKTRIGPFCRIDAKVWLEDVRLGAYSMVGTGSIWSNTSIGAFTTISQFTLGGLGIHPTRNFVSNHFLFYHPAKLSSMPISFTSSSHFEGKKAINIGNDVYIGAKAMVIDGVTIGDGAIVGAGAVVTKDIPPYAIVGGVPAKLIRYRFSPEEIAFLQATKWWEWDKGLLKELHRDFHHIDSLKKIVWERKLPGHELLKADELLVQ